MALKSCPRCFKEIPEESRVCSHCGTELKKCPRCETLAIKETETCSRCGARFTSGILIEDPEVSVNNVVNHVREFKKKNLLLSLLSNQMVWSAISVFFIAAGIIIYVVSMNNASLTDWNSSSNLMIWSLVLAFIGYSIKMVPYTFAEIMIPKKLFKFTESVGFDIRPHLSNGSAAIPKNAKTIFATRKLDFELAKTSEYAKQFPNEYNKYRIFNIARFAGFIVLEAAFIVSTVLLTKVAPDIILAGGTAKNIFASLPAIVWYVSVGAELVFSIAQTLIQSSFNKTRDEWIKTV